MTRLWIMALSIVPVSAFAGMPVFRVNEIVHFRLQALSFFLFAFAICALLVKLLWNYLQKDFTSLPRLTYLKAAGFTLMIGLLFMCVLTMISGARELMTPGAWKKDGATYKLDTGGYADPALQRRARLERLWVALNNYAMSHDGKFPPHEFVPELPPELWVAEADGSRFIYLVGLTTKSPEPQILAYEPNLKETDRLVLMSDGKITEMSLRNIQQHVTAATDAERK